MAKQLLIDAYRGKMTPSPPWVPYSGVHSAFLINQPAETFLKDSKIMAEGVVAAARRYKADGIPLLFSRQARSLITPLLVDTIAMPMPPRTFGRSSTDA